MDPQLRLLLETSWQALEDAALNPETLINSRTGAYAGIDGSEYRELASAVGNGATFKSSTASMSLGRIAYERGLWGARNAG